MRHRFILLYSFYFSYSLFLVGSREPAPLLIHPSERTSSEAVPEQRAGALQQLRNENRTSHCPSKNCLCVYSLGVGIFLCTTYLIICKVNPNISTFCAPQIALY